MAVAVAPMPHNAGGITGPVSYVAPIAQPQGRVMQRSLSERRVIQQGADHLMQAQHYPAGLRAQVIASCNQFPSRIWIVDNSGSMGKCDGKKLMAIRNKPAKQLVQCSRWEELCTAVEAHVDLVSSLKVPTDFRLLNKSYETGKQFFSVSSMDDAELKTQTSEAKSIMRLSVPHDATPLTMHLYAVRERIVTELGPLMSQGQRVVVVIATDGVPSDSTGRTNYRTKQEFKDALQQLHGLPVWVVVRLLTDDEEVAEYWNQIDSQLELSLEVLDDWLGEAAEIYRHNPWLNYPELRASGGVCHVFVVGGTLGTAVG